MFDPQFNPDLWHSVAIAAVGAGVVTTFAIGQGQHPLVALVVTGMATAVAVVCDRSGWF